MRDVNFAEEKVARIDQEVDKVFPEFRKVFIFWPKKCVKLWDVRILYLMGVSKILTHFMGVRSTPM